MALPDNLEYPVLPLVPFQPGYRLVKGEDLNALAAVALGAAGNLISSEWFVSPDAEDAKPGLQAFFDYLVLHNLSGYVAHGHYHMSRALTLENANGIALEFAPGTIFDVSIPSGGANGLNFNECSNLTIVNPPEVRLNRSTLGSGTHGVVFRNPNPGVGAPNGIIIVTGAWKVTDWGSNCILTYRNTGTLPGATDTVGNWHCESVFCDAVLNPSDPPVSNGKYGSYAVGGLLLSEVVNSGIQFSRVTNVLGRGGTGPAVAVQVKNLGCINCYYSEWEVENCYLAIGAGNDAGGAGPYDCYFGPGLADHCKLIWINSGGSQQTISGVTFNMDGQINDCNQSLIKHTGSGAHRSVFNDIIIRDYRTDDITLPIISISGDENVFNIQMVGMVSGRSKYVEFLFACDRNAVNIGMDTRDSNSGQYTLLSRVIDDSGNLNNTVTLQSGNTAEVWRNGANGPTVLDQRYGSLAPYPTESQGLGTSSGRWSLIRGVYFDAKTQSAATVASAASNQGRLTRLSDGLNGRPAWVCAIGAEYRPALFEQTFTPTDEGVGGGTIAANSSAEVIVPIPGVLIGDPILYCAVTQNLENGLGLGSQRMAVDGEILAQVLNYTAGGVAWTPKTWRVTVGAAALDPAAAALIARFTTPPSAYEVQWINTTIIGLKDFGVWELLDFLHYYWLADSQSSSLNWIKTTHTSVNNGCTFTPYVGFTGDSGALAFLDLNYAPATAADNMTQDDASIGVYQVAPSTISGGYLLGQQTTTGGGYTRIRQRFTGDLFQARINSGNSLSVGPVTDAVAMSAIVRYDANTVQAYFGPDALGDPETDNVSEGLPTSNLTGLKDSALYSDATIGMCWAGAALSDVQIAGLNGLTEALRQAMIDHP